MQFYDGDFARVRAIPRGEAARALLGVSSRLDTLTLDGLRASLDESLGSSIESSSSAASATRCGRALRLIEGGRERAPRTSKLHGRSGVAYLVLDDEDRIVQSPRRLHDELVHWLGHVLWDHLPAAKPLYGPSFDEARASGQPVEFTSSSMRDG